MYCRSFPRAWDNRGYPKNGQSMDTPTLPFLPNFSWAFLRMDPVIVLAKFEVRSFTRSWDNSDWSFGWGANPNLGEGEAVGGRDGTIRRSVVEFLYRPSIVTFSVSLRVSEILPLLCSSTPLFHTPPLVSPKFPNVPLGLGGWPLGCEERRCWANCSCS